MSADAFKDNDSIVSDADSTYSESNLPSADEEDDMTYKELCTRMDRWEEAEVDLYFFVKKWVEADEEDRMQYLDDLLERLKFCNMTLAELTQIQSSKLYSEGSGAWRVVVDEAVASILAADAARMLDIESKVADNDSVYSESNLPSADEDDDPVNMTYNNLVLMMDNWRDAEINLFSLVKKWVEAEDENRRQHLDNLMERIRFCLMTPAELTQLQSAKMYTEGSQACRVLVDKAVEYHKLPINMKILHDSEQSTVRGKPAVTCIMHFIEFEDGSLSNMLKHLYTLDTDMNWYKANIPPQFPIWHVVACVVVNNFLITTSEQPSVYTQDFFVFDPRTLEYVDIPSLGKCREECSLVHHNGCLYFIGCISRKKSVHGSVQKYEFKTNKWSHFVNLPKLDSYKVACVFQDHIYVTDGHNVKCLDPSTKTWENKAPLVAEVGPNSQRMCVMKVQGQERLCVVDEDCGLEYYDKSTDKWSKLNCSFSRKLDDYIGFADGMVVDGNKVLFYDDHLLGRWDNGGVCLQVTYPEEGNNVDVKTLDEHFYPYPVSADGNLSAHGVMLTVPAHKVDIPHYRIPDDDELYYPECDDSDDSNETESD